MLVLHEAGRDLDGPLTDVLRLLRPTLGSERYLIDSAPGLVAAFQRACRDLAAHRPRRRRPRLPDGLSIMRTNGTALVDLEDPRLFFMNGTFGPARRRPDPDRAAKLIAQVRKGVVEQGAGIVPMSHGAALFRLWAAMRDLMDETTTPWRASEFAPLWDEALGFWAAKASWFGLHGHVWMGPLAAVNLQLNTRKDGSLEGSVPVREPHGARASALYSIAGIVHSPARQLLHYRQALYAAETSLDRDPAARQGTLAIKGNALMRLAMLGRPLEIFAACAALRESLDIRIRNGAPDASVGEAMADLGFCLVLSMRPLEGLPLLRQGVSHLRQDSSPDGLSFLSRGLRKLEHAYRLTLHWKRAADAHAERQQISAALEAFDQVRR